MSVASEFNVSYPKFWIIKNILLFEFIGVVLTAFIEPLTVIEYVSKCLEKDLHNSKLTDVVIRKVFVCP